VHRGEGNADVIVTLGRTAAARRAGRRLHARLEGPQQLSGFLAATDAKSVTLRAPWPLLTSDVLRQLAEWAIDRPGRGCGVVPVTSAPPTVCVQSHQCAATALLSDTLGTWLLAGTRLSPIATEELLGQICATYPPTALALSGHGGEHCISIGSDWIGTYPAASISGRLLSPDLVGSPAVFLNTCGSLRLGDSVVPPHYSLALRLYQRGAAVIGAYRNQFTFPEAPLIFARGVLAGLPMGQIAAHLSAEARGRGDATASYQLLGDAAQPAVPRPLGSGWASDERASGTSGAFGPLILELVFLDQLTTTLANWPELVAESQQATVEFRNSLRTVLHAEHASYRRLISAEDAETIEFVGRSAVVKQRGTLLRMLGICAARGQWPQSLYACISAQPAVRVQCCPRCGGRAMAYDFTPFQRGFLPLRSIDCDGCGAISDAFGEPPDAPALPEMSVRDGVIEIALPPLGVCSSGRVAVHRSGLENGQEWPPHGGEIGIPLAPIPFRGKTTIAASQAGPGFLRVNYVTTFVD